TKRLGDMQLRGLRLLRQRCPGESPIVPSARLVNVLFVRISTRPDPVHADSDPWCRRIRGSREVDRRGFPDGQLARLGVGPRWLGEVELERGQHFLRGDTAHDVVLPDRGRSGAYRVR